MDRGWWGWMPAGGGSPRLIWISLAVEILPLLEPDQEPIPLERCDRGTWRIPQESLEPGPHLIVGRQGDWQRVQPMPWYFAGPGGHSEDADSSAIATVAQAYFIASQRTDRSSDEPFGAVVGQLARDPGHPDWPLVFGFLRQTSLSRSDLSAASRPSSKSRCVRNGRGPRQR